eukprot:scaffold10260_cov266-Chaetoceros_neogracile.AAC.69
MIIIAFFFFPRPGDYTNITFDTTPFTLNDIQLFIGGRSLHIPTSSDAEIITFVLPNFTEEKNGVHGEDIGLGLSGDH